MSTEPAARRIFRPEALAALETANKDGHPLRLVPTWTSAAYWFLVSVVVTAISYGSVARVSEYAEGPAMVRVEGRHDLTASTSGIVIGVDVQPGSEVTTGQVLVRFQTETERQDLAQIEREMELKLVRLLLHPADEGTRQALSALRASRERAEARLRERSVVAPRPGVVRNLRIRTGQLLSPGDPILTLVDEASASFTVLALVPGQFRPQLKPGLPVRFKLEGWSRMPDTLRVESVGDEVVGPGEARRYLGQELGDTVAVQGSLVLVRARLPRSTFSVEGRTYRYYDGVPGKVDIRVRSLRLLVMLFPPLRELFGRAA
jgi:multidrug efflux pump subunit AcrA (membrane-fusion protein)